MQATRKQKANASWCIIALIALIKHHLQTHAGSRLPCCNVWFDVWLLQNPNRKKRPWLPELTDALFLRLQATWRSFRMHAEKCYESYENTTRYEGYKRNPMRFMSCLNKMTICHNYDFHYNRPILRFPRPQLESLQGSCSLIILKLLTSEKRFVGTKWKANGWLKGPGVCHHNAAGWSSPETMGQTKVEGRIFLAKYTSLKNNMMHETVLPDALDADMGKLPSRKSEIRSACCRRACDLSSQGNSSRILRWLSHHGAEKMRRLKKKIPTKKMSDIAMFPCSHGDLWVCIFVPIPEPRDLFWILQVFVLLEHLVASYSSIRTMFVWKCCVIVHKLYGSIWQLGLPWRLSLSFAIWRGKHLFTSPTMLCSCLVLSSLRSCRSAPLFPSNTTPTTAAHRIVFAPQRSEKTPSSNLNWRQIKC